MPKEGIYGLQGRLKRDMNCIWIRLPKLKAYILPILFPVSLLRNMTFKKKKLTKYRYCGKNLRGHFLIRDKEGVAGQVIWILIRTNEKVGSTKGVSPPQCNQPRFKSSLGLCSYLITELFPKKDYGDPWETNKRLKEWYENRTFLPTNLQSPPSSSDMFLTACVI